MYPSASRRWIARPDQVRVPDRLISPRQPPSESSNRNLSGFGPGFMLYRLFPDGPNRTTVALVMNIDPIFEAVGTSMPYNIWLSLAEDADPVAVQAAVSELGFPLLEWRDPEVAMDVARAAPSRRGAESGATAG